MIKFKQIKLLVLCIFFSLKLIAHDGGHKHSKKEWILKTNHKVLKANLIKLDKNYVWFNNEANTENKRYIIKKHQKIKFTNKNIRPIILVSNTRKLIVLTVGVLLLFLSTLLYKTKRKKLHLSYGMIGFGLIILISCSKESSEITNNTTNNIIENDVLLMASIFEKFSAVSTTHDEAYFYISSNGIPDHNMMIGITNWQQQIPINQDYTGNNSWAIPIKPTLADSPLSTKTNLLKGALAIAVNGIPIFNPLNNRGEDANKIGELDQWGGHCGRADDYHYHLPPTHLQTTVGANQPIAYALDGFPLYGTTTENLDECLGKFNDDGSYQYHTINEYPYFMAAVRGKIALDPNTTAPENQISPQATTKGVRPALTPLAGAEITKFEFTNVNSYSLTYILNLETYMINYNWDDNGVYTYEFINPNSNKIETYTK